MRCIKVLLPSPAKMEAKVFGEVEHMWRKTDASRSAAVSRVEL